MSLLHYTKLRDKFQNASAKTLFSVFLFSMDDKAVKIYSERNCTQFYAFLNSSLPSGKVGELFFSGTNLFLCIGKLKDTSPIVRRANICKATKSLYTNLKRFENARISFEDSEFTEDAIYALVLSGYSFDFLKKHKDETSFYLDPQSSGKSYREILEVAHHQNIARFLSDAPANLLTPTAFVEYANDLLANLPNVSLTAYGKEEIEKMGMNLILSVNQGSLQEPWLLSVSYQGKKNSDKVDVALVGKGVCFDSGGISIKPSLNMHRMKHDMMGAATMLSTLRLAAVLAMEINLTLTVPLVENMPSGSATRPGDVYKSMSGITVQVDNTDAEGRLILADALTFAQQRKPKYLFDAATLTGAMVIALGNVYAGFFTESDELASKIYKAGEETGDLLWRMPLSPFYREKMKSPVADINNIGGSDGGSCKAAEFLKEFVDTKECCWAHFDIAGVSDGSYMPEVHGEETTGRPVRAFIRLLEKLKD